MTGGTINLSRRLIRHTAYGHRVICALPPKADMCGALADVRFVPKADIAACPRDVCITPESGYRTDELACRLSAMNMPGALRSPPMAYREPRRLLSSNPFQFILGNIR